MKLSLSTLPPFNAMQRWISQLVWGRWLAGFLFWELTGTRRYTPWRTLSETAWDTEQHHPETRGLLQGFLLGLAIHIRYRTTLKSSFRVGMAMQANFDALLEEVMPSDPDSSGQPVTRPLAGGQGDGGRQGAVGEP